MSGKLLSVERGERIRDDRAHGSLLILNELLCCANVFWERKYIALQESTDTKREDDVEQFSLSRPQFMYLMHAKKKSHNLAIATSLAEKPVVIESIICHQLVSEKFDYICMDVLAQK